MKIELYLVSAYEEYAGKHACTKHWNFQWKGRRKTSEEKHMCRVHWNYNWRARRKGSPLEENVQIRPESFGGLMQTPDGKLWKLDHEAYYWLNLLLGGNT